MQKTVKLRKKADIVIPITGIALSFFGLTMILSASQIMAADRYDSSYYFFTKQLVAWILGMGAFFFFLKVPLDYIYQNRVKLLWITVFTLILVFVPIIGPEIAGVHRWIDLGFFQFQSAELAKLTMIIFFSGFFASRMNDMNEPKRVLLPFVVILGFISALIMMEPDLGTTFIIVLSAMAIFFVAKAPLIQFISLCLAGAILLTGLIFAAPYRAERFLSFVERVNNTHDTLGSSYHTHQASIAIGSGGMWGLGFGQGTSKYSYLPQAHTDSIFAVVAEELGFFRTSLILLAFLFLCWRGIRVAQKANSRFVQLLAIGISVVLTSQALVNIAGMLSVLPLTGVPLPFISYGGSSLIISLASLGMLTNLSRETNA